MRLWTAFYLAVAVIVAGSGCGYGRTSPSPSPTVAAPSTTTATVSTRRGAGTTGAGVLQAEATATSAGDIPDNQVFLVFHDAGAGYSIKYPEGWAQQGSGGSVTFRDKNNVIRAEVSAGAAWTPTRVRADVRALKGAQVQSPPRKITFSGQPVFKVVYRTVSAPNPVTGKRVDLSVDRYYLWKHGRRAVLDLGMPRGRRQRRCLPVDQRELSVELTSLYREPERRTEISFGAIEFHDVFRIFRAGQAETVALRGLDLRIEPGEFVALFGPSGSGKSTALHLAAGLDEASAGDVLVFGRSLARLGEAELADYRARDIALVFQSGNLWPDLSARENVVLGLRLAGRPASSETRRARARRVRPAAP